MILEGRSQMGGNFLAGVATDETDPDHEIDRLALTLNYALSHHHTQPQKHRGTMLKMYLVGALLSSPKLKEKAGGHINEGMIAPYKKVVEGAKTSLCRKMGKLKKGNPFLSYIEKNARMT